MKISVIIPTYKPQSYIEECLFSIKSQTFDKAQFDVHIILNGCNEPYYTKIKEFVSINLQEYNVKVTQTDIAGVSNARNIGLDVAQGEYIAFLDDDDYISPTYLEQLFKITSQDTIAISNLVAFKDQSNEMLPYYVSNAYNKIIKLDKITIINSRSFFSGPWAKLIHRDIIGTRRFNIKLSNSEDGLFMFTISNLVDKIKCTSSDAIYFRRVRLQSATTQKRTKSYLLKNFSVLVYNYTSIYIKSPFSYNVFFFTTRILASLKTLFFKLSKE